MQYCTTIAQNGSIAHLLFVPLLCAYCDAALFSTYLLCGVIGRGQWIYPANCFVSKKCNNAKYNVRYDEIKAAIYNM